MTNLRNLRTKKGRDEQHLFVVEGEKQIAEIPASHKIVCFAVSQKFAEAHDLTRYKNIARVEVIRESLFAAIADTVTPQGILAVCEKKEYRLSDLFGNTHKPNIGLAHNEPPFVLLGENLSDPGNIGTLIRTAAAAGASSAVFTRGSCDIYSPKVIRSAAGAILRLPCVADANLPDVFSALKAEEIPVYAAHPRGDTLPYELNLREKVCLLIGNEAHGISDAARAAATATVRLPMPGETESLNASVAGGILMYEAVRQRLN